MRAYGKHFTMRFLNTECDRVPQFRPGPGDVLANVYWNATFQLCRVLDSRRAKKFTHVECVTIDSDDLEPGEEIYCQVFPTPRRDATA